MSVPHPNLGRAQKRAKFAPDRTSKGKIVIPILFLGLVGIGAYLVGNNLSGRPAAGTATTVAATPSSESATSGAPAGNEIAIPLPDLTSGQAKFFEYMASDKTPVRFFAIKSSDGVYRAALDACDVCYQGKQGYQQSGDDMVCRKCGRHFPSALVNEVTGGCNPIAVTRTTSGNKLLIKTADLESMKAYF